MLTAYRRVFSRPGALAFSATALVARLPIAMMTLGIVLLVSALTGSYGLAGQVSAAYIIGNAVFAIPHGRLTDRFGQRRVLYVDAGAFAVTTTLMIVAIVEDWARPCAPAGHTCCPSPASATRPSRQRASRTRSCSSPDRHWSRCCRPPSLPR